MGITVTGKLNDFTADINKKAIEFTKEVTNSAASIALEYTPREYGRLANSQYVTVRSDSTGVYGTVGYTADYAALLNGTGSSTPNWHPESAKDKDGPLSNMKATPGFINKGFESSKAESRINSFKRILKL